MPIKDKLTKLKTRYNELLAETQESNKTWGDEFYDEESAQEGWQCAKTFVITGFSQIFCEVGSKMVRPKFIANDYTKNVFKPSWEDDDDWDNWA